MTYDEAMKLIQEHLDYGGSLDEHALAIAISGAAEAQQSEAVAWANMKDDGTVVALSQHPEDIARWANPIPLFAAPTAPAPSNRGGEAESDKASPLVNFVTYLVDNCEGQVITEDALTEWLADVIDITPRETPAKQATEWRLVASAASQSAEPVARYEDLRHEFDAKMRERESNLLSVYAATGAQMTDEQIRAVFLANGFTIKEGQTDLKPYVYAAARKLLALAATPAPSQEAEDSEMLDWLDTTNARFRMGWRVGVAPAGNASISTVIHVGEQPVTSIRAAIRAAMSREQSTNKETPDA